MSVICPQRCDMTHLRKPISAAAWCRCMSSFSIWNSQYLYALPFLWMYTSALPMKLLQHVPIPNLLWIVITRGYNQLMHLWMTLKIELYSSCLYTSELVCTGHVLQRAWEPQTCSVLSAFHGPAETLLENSYLRCARKVGGMENLKKEQYEKTKYIFQMLDWL